MLLKDRYLFFLYRNNLSVAFWWAANDSSYCRGSKVTFQLVGGLFLFRNVVTPHRFIYTKLRCACICKAFCMHLHLNFYVETKNVCKMYPFIHWLFKYDQSSLNSPACAWSWLWLWLWIWLWPLPCLPLEPVCLGLRLSLKLWVRLWQLDLRPTGSTWFTLELQRWLHNLTLSVGAAWFKPAEPWLRLGLGMWFWFWFWLRAWTTLCCSIVRQSPRQLNVAAEVAFKKSRSLTNGKKK